MSEHTPTPWKVRVNVATNEFFVERSIYCGSSETNAEFLVDEMNNEERKKERAVNSHDAMVAALENILAHADLHKVSTAMLIQANNALALAEPKAQGKEGE